MSYGEESVPENAYYLYVGTRSGYKNFRRLLYAFAKVVSCYPEVNLCVVGSPLKDKERQLMSELKLINDVIHYSFPSDNYLAKLYRHSIALVYPSLYEGFGIPPLEAMACGTVAIASNSSSLPEVLGNAGILFDPESTEQLADIMLSLINSPIERDSWIAKGKKQAELFSWEPKL
jgi:glycosyltransferase involved in cell wall biosynthesis